MSFSVMSNSLNVNNPYHSLPLNNCSYSSPITDNFGNITLPQSFAQRRSSPPPSPPWGQSARKDVTMNVSYKLQPIGIVPATGHFLNGGHVGNVMLCTLTPVLGQQRDLAKHEQIKLHRVKSIRNRKRALFGRSLSFSQSLKQRKLKRLQRRPLLKAKKQEVYEKWERRKSRREFKSRRQRSADLPLTDGSIFSTSAFMDATTSFREGSESPFQCPLWCCNRRRRRSRREDYEQGYARPRKASRISCLSDKSRSPISIRSSPITQL